MHTFGLENRLGCDVMQYDTILYTRYYIQTEYKKSEGERKQNILF